MFNNNYLLSIKGKDVKRFLKSLYKRGIRFINIVVLDNVLICKVDSNNYKKIKEIKTTYKITISKTFGIIYLKELIKKNFIFLLFFVFGNIYLFFLSNIIFKINIIHDDNNLREIVNNELDNMGIKKYSFIKSYKYIQEIKEKILDNNKDIIEWIEIDRIGSTYNVRLEKRIKNREKIEDNNRHLVAKKSGIIKKIEAHDGEIVKKINDYVSRGDIIISGIIHKKDDVKDNISALGKVYAEVWYKVKVNLPLYYYEKKSTGKNLNTLKIIILDKEYNLFNKKYKYKESTNNVLFSDFYNMFSINYSNDKEINIIDDINTISEENIAVNLAREKILNRLDTDEYIISQKKLKTTLNNSTINVEVFFKVYENISSYSYYN